MATQRTRQFHFNLLIGLLLCGIGLYVPGTQAQAPADSVVADTLDWHRYSPLEVGNIWEYQVYEVTSLMRREILGDTLAAGHTYFIVEETWQGGTFLPRQTFFVRYDTAGVVVSLPDLEADTTAYPRAFPVEYVADAEFLEYFDLRTAFGDTLYIDTERFETYWVGGGYEQSLQFSGTTVPLAGLKCLYLAGWYECYATDIGYLDGGGGPYFQLIYAKIGNREYGTSQMTAIERDPPVGQRFVIESIYPNPFKDKARLVYDLARSQPVSVEIFDVLGRKIRAERTGIQHAGEHEYVLSARGLAAGIYFVHLITASEDRVVRSVIVLK